MADEPLTHGLAPEQQPAALTFEALMDLKKRWEAHVAGSPIVEAWVERGLLESLPRFSAPPGVLCAPGLRVRESDFLPPGYTIGRRVDGSLVIWKQEQEQEG